MKNATLIIETAVTPRPRPFRLSPVTRPPLPAHDPARIRRLDEKDALVAVAHAHRVDKDAEAARRDRDLGRRREPLDPDIGPNQGQVGQSSPEGTRDDRDRPAAAGREVV